MTPDALVSTLEARGIHLRVDGPDLVVRPAEGLTPEDIAHLKEAKPDVVAVLRGRALGVDWSRVSLYQVDRVIEVAVPWADVPIIIAPGCRVARELRAQDPTPGRAWCVCEVIDLLLSGVSPEDARKIAEAKLVFGGTVTNANGQR